MLLGEYKVIGILGGMGPEATVDLYRHIIELTPAKKDQDHIPTLIFSNPKVPDRTQSIHSKNSHKIIRHLREGAQILENGGADFITIPCNTAHRFIEEIQDAVTIPVVHMIEETVSFLIRAHPKIATVGILATTGTLNSNLYQDYLCRNNIKAEIPENSIQENSVMKAIYSIKAGNNDRQCSDLLKLAIKSMSPSAQQVVIMGCTEIPLALTSPIKGTILINPTKILAKIAIAMSMNNS